MSCRCQLYMSSGCPETEEAMAAVTAMVAAVPKTLLYISLSNPLSHHLHQLERTEHELRELYSVQRDNQLYGRCTVLVLY